MFSALVAVGCTCGMCEPDEPDNSGCAPALTGPDSGGYAGYGGYGGYAGHGGYGGYGGSGGADPDASLCGVDAGVQSALGADGGCVAVGCVVGRADCNSDLVSDGCETEITDDSVHCGACGHACGEPACEHGSCLEPEVAFAMPETEITAFAVDAEGIYYATRGAFQHLGFAPTAGAYQHLTFLSDAVSQIEVHASIVVFGDDGWIRVLDTKNVLPEKSVGGIYPARWVSDATHLYVAEEIPGSTSWDASIDDATAEADADADATEAAVPAFVRVTRHAIAPPGKQVLWETAGRLGAISTQGGALYVGVASPGRLFGFPSAAQGPQLLASGPFDPSRLAVSGGFLYAADALGQRIVRVSTAGGPLQAVATLSRQASDLHVDAGQVWVGLSPPAELWRHAPAGSTLLAGALAPNTNVAVDATHAYWVFPGVGVLRAPR